MGRRLRNGAGTLCQRPRRGWRALKAACRATVLGVCAGLMPALAMAMAEAVRLENSRIRLEIERGTGSLLALVETVSGQNLATPAPVGSLWQLEFGGEPAVTLSPANAAACDVEKLAGGEPGLRLVWSKFGWAEAPELRVNVTVRLDPAQSMSRWHLAVEAAGARPLQRVRFPRILDLPRLERERLAVPFWAGLLSPNPRQLFIPPSTNAVRKEYGYPGLCSMQFLAFYSDAGPGLYLATDDTAGYRKSLAAFSNSRRPAESQAPAGTNAAGAAGTEPLPDLNLEIVHLPDRREAAQTRYALPCSALVGTFRGGWFDAAAIYRAWATNQTWALESRWKRGTTPAWVGSAGLWIWNRGRSKDVVEPAIAMQDALGLPVSILWHWWHGCAYDVGFPEYLPPRDGDGPFMAAMDRAHAHDVRALVYMNQRLWGMTTASWTNENAAAFAVKGADGQIKPEVYNTFTKLPCATMCMGTDFWRSKYASLAEEAYQRLQVDGIYMDQACSSLACFDAQHGHPAGGGTYWISGFKTLMADIRRQCASRGGVALAGEGCAENWLPYLDLMLALDVSRERYCEPDGWEPIPLFQAVYHGFGTFFGSYSSLTSPPYDELWPAEFAPQEPLALLDRKFSPQFFLEQARAFIWGQQLALANFRSSQLKDRAVEVDYVMRLARLRQRALKYLQDGSMLRPPTVDVPAVELPLSRLSIYAGQQGTPKEFAKTVPTVLASAWRALDGAVAVVVANIADHPVNSAVRVEPGTAVLRQPGRFRGLEGGHPVEATAGEDGALLLQLDLEPLEAQILEWRVF